MLCSGNIVDLMFKYTYLIFRFDFMWKLSRQNSQALMTLIGGMRVMLFSWFLHFWKFSCAQISAFSFIFSLLLTFYLISCCNLVVVVGFFFFLPVAASHLWLTAHNWQKWKRVFLTCPCHEIYRDEAVGLKSCKYTWKITILVKMWNLGQYRENLIFCQ